MTEHNSGDRVTWRDLDRRTADLATNRELDRRISEHERRHRDERRADQEAIRLAREALADALMKTNNFREEATQDKARFAETAFVNAELAKLEATIRTDYAKELAAVNARISTLATSFSSTSSDVRSLQNAETKAAGADRGNLALVVSMAAVILTVIANLGGRLIFG